MKTVHELESGDKKPAIPKLAWLNKRLKQLKNNWKIVQFLIFHILLVAGDIGTDIYAAVSFYKWVKTSGLF